MPQHPTPSLPEVHGPLPPLPSPSSSSPPPPILPINPFTPSPSFPTSHPHLHPQTPPHPLPHRLLELTPPLPPHLRRLDIRRTLIIRLRQHAHHTDQYLLHTLYRTPPLGGLFVVVRVVARGVQDGDADEAGGVNCACRQHVSRCSPVPIYGNDFDSKRASESTVLSCLNVVDGAVAWNLYRSGATLPPRTASWVDSADNPWGTSTRPGKYRLRRACRQVLGLVLPRGRYRLRRQGRR